MDRKKDPVWKMQDTLNENYYDIIPVNLNN